MATIPNLYFQSPHIEAAARNLASALAPPDPMQKLERESKAFAFEEAKKAAGRKDVEIADEEKARSIAAQIAELQPVRNPDGTINKDATRAELGRLYGEFIKHRGSAKEANLIAGPYAPDFISRLALAQAGYNAKAGIVDRQLNYYRGRDAMLEGGRNQRFKLGLSQARNIAEAKLNAGFMLELERGKARLAAARAAGGGKVTQMSESDLETITYLIMLKEEMSGKELYQDERDRLVDAALAIKQKTGNPQGAVNFVWDKTLPGVGKRPTQPTDGLAGFYYDNIADYEDPFLTPDFSQLKPEDFGNVLAPGGAPGTTPATAPRISIPPPSADPTAPPQPSRPPKPGAGAAKRKQGDKAVDKEGKTIVWGVKSNGKEGWVYP